MIIHKCDICGREMGRWIVLSIEAVDAVSAWQNVGDLLPFIGKFEWCPECARRTLLDHRSKGAEE